MSDSTRWSFRVPPRTLIHAFFFTSGIPALAYQLIWQRVLFRIFGVNMESVTVVVTAFMLGLGIGSLLGSWLSTRRTLSPLLVIAAMELAIGCFGLWSLDLFSLADMFVQELSLPAKAFVAVALLLIPTAMMGATLPLLVGHVVQRSANVGVSTGGLYRANVLGAVVGCIGCALLLFPWLGLQGSVEIAAGFNGIVAAIALAAFLLQRGEPAPGDAVRPSSGPPPGRGRLSFAASLVLALVGGFVSLSYEIFLFHLASFASGTNPFVFAVVLSAFLLGIASGARLAADWCKGRSPEADLPAGIFNLLLFNGLFGLAILPILAISAPLGRGLIGVIVLAAYLVARSLGVIFPVVAHFAVLPDRESGGRVGLLYVANILGSASGSLLTGFVLSDILGARGLAILLSMLAFGIVALLAFLSGRWGGGSRLALGVTVAVAAALVVLQEPLTATVVESMLYKRNASRSPPLARVVENRNGIIAVTPSGTVYGGGVYDGRFNVDLRHDTNGIIRPFGLSLYHPRPRNVLMIGLSTGSWAQVVANHPDVERLTVVEINPGYLALVRERPEVTSVLTNDKVRIVIDDGRRWLNVHADEKFDAVFANTTFHFRSNASNLLSLEFNALIRAHLKPGGIYSYNTTGSLRVAATGCRSFRQGYLVLNHLVVGDSTFDLDVERWRRNLLAYRIDGRPVLEPERPSDAEVLRKTLALPDHANEAFDASDIHAMEGCASILRRSAGLRTITDDNMGTEWRYALGLDGETIEGR